MFLYQIKFAVDDFRRNKTRSLLTSLGIFIGVLSVVLLMAIGKGLKVYIQNQFDSLGTNLLIVVPGNIFSDEGGFQDSEGGFGSVTFTNRDITAISRLNGAKYVVPTFIKTSSVKARDNTHLTDIFASPPEIFIMRNLTAEYGQLYTTADERKSAKYAVLGSQIAEDLFGSSLTAVNQSIRIENQRYTVKGVLKPLGGGGLGGPSFDSFTYLPLSSTFSLNPNQDILSIYIQASSSGIIPTLKEDIRKTLLKRLQDEDFSVIEQTEILKAVSSIFGMINIVLVAIASISLLVGGVGIMNIMYASISSRIKEIGIRRAIGATQKSILSQFLFEAVTISLAGGLLGLATALVAVLIIRYWFPASIDMVAISLALGVSSGVGILFGVFPARRAAHLPPIESIRRG